MVELLPVQVGLHELRMMMTLNRENYESVHSWLQRLNEGKRVLESHNIVLPDAIYAQLAIDYLTFKEKTDLTAKVGSATQRSRFTKQKLTRMLYDQSFEKNRHYSPEHPRILLGLSALDTKSTPQASGFHRSASTQIFRQWPQTAGESSPEKAQT